MENNVTISTHNGSQVARQHNLRNPKVIAKEDHIDPNGHFEVWLEHKWNTRGQVYCVGQKKTVLICAVF